MIKNIWLIIIVLFFQGCSDFVDAINNFELPEWETEISFHLLGKKVVLNDQINNNTIIAYDCIDTALCDTSRGKIYMLEIIDSIPTITVGESLVFEDINKNFNQSLDNVEMSPLTETLETEIGIISLGDMPPQSTPEFAFNEIVPQGILSNIETAMGLGNSMIVIPSFEIDTIEQEFTFNSFSNVEIENSSIQITITNNMFITLGDTINITLIDTSGSETYGELEFQQPIATSASASEILYLNQVTLPGTIKILISGSSLGTDGVEEEVTDEDLDSGFFVSISVIEMNVLSATANIPTQILGKSGKFKIEQSNDQIELESAIIEHGFLGLNVNNGIPLNSQLTMNIPALTDQMGTPFSTVFQIMADAITSPTPITLSNYTLDLSEDSLEYIYTVTTDPDSVTIDHTNMVSVELELNDIDNNGIKFSLITGIINEEITDSNSIELNSGTKLESAVIDSGQMKLTIENGLNINAEIDFTLTEFISEMNDTLHSVIALENNDSITTHIIVLSNYTIQLPNGSAEGIEPQILNYISSISFDSSAIQEINLNSSLGINIEITGLQFNSISGILDPLTESTQIEFPIELPGTINEYSEQLDGFDFYKPDIQLIIQSSIGVPIEIELNLKSFKTAMNDDGINPIYLDSASYDTTLSIIPNLDDSIFNLINTENLLNIFPNKISANVYAQIGGGDIVGGVNQASQLGGIINVKVPLAFIIKDTLSIDLEMSKINPLDEKLQNVKHAEIISEISTSLDFNFDISAYIYTDTLDLYPLDTLIRNISMNGGDTIKNYSEFDSTLLSHMVNDTTYIKPIIKIMGEYDEEGNSLPFIIYSTDSIYLDIIGNANILVDSLLTTGGE